MPEDVFDHRKFDITVRTTVSKVTPSPSNVVQLDDTNLRSQLESTGLALKVGDVYEFRVHENPSTGYKWNLTAASQTAINGIISVDKTYVQDSAPVGFTGVGGQAFYKITAIGTGTASFEINEIRPWEPEKFVDHIQIPITVNP